MLLDTPLADTHKFGKDFSSELVAVSPDQESAAVSRRAVPGSSADITKRAPQFGRRLTDKLLAAFYHACDERDFDVAVRLLLAVETLLSRPIRDLMMRRREQQRLVAAYQYLWELRQPHEGE